MGAHVKIRLRYVIEDVDRYGFVRRYVRVPGRKKVRLLDPPGSEAFMVAYHAAMDGEPAAAQPQPGEVRQGSFRQLCIRYYASSAFTRLDESTQSWQRRHLDAISRRHGHKPHALLTDQYVRKLRDEIKATPGASKTRLKALRALFRWAIEAGEARHNPTLGVQALAYVTRGHHSWSIEEVEQYERRHPVGTKPRLAMALLLYTSWRREDAVRLGPQHVVIRKRPEGGISRRIQYRQAKNEHRNPVDMDVPLHPDLADIIAATPARHLTFLVTEWGKPYSAAGFGNTFKDWCRQANLPHCSAHGLRKATAARLAERGATAHEIMAMTGLRTLEEAERYTRAAAMSKLADSAMAKLRGRTET